MPTLINVYSQIEYIGNVIFSCWEHFRSFYARMWMQPWESWCLGQMRFWFLINLIKSILKTHGWFHNQLLKYHTLLKITVAKISDPWLIVSHWGKALGDSVAHTESHWKSEGWTQTCHWLLLNVERPMRIAHLTVLLMVEFYRIYRKQHKAVLLHRFDWEFIMIE